MFRFFRSIRQSLLAENKTFKYLKYAVGEVLLVVIGILIALSVNNWNEGKKLELVRLELIENLKADFRANELRLQKVALGHEAKIEKMDQFLKAATNEGEPVSVSRMKELYASFHKSDIFVPVLGSYNTSISTGSIALLNDPSLNELLIEFVGYHETLERFLNQYTLDVFSGKSSENRDQLGSLWQLWNYDAYQPEMFKLTDEEYRTFVAQKHVYSGFENKYFLYSIMLSLVRDLSETTEQILEAL